MSEYIYQSQGEPLMNEHGVIYLARAGEIVRCKNCEFCITLTAGIYCNRMALYVEPDSFCKWACRKSKEGGE